MVWAEGAENEIRGGGWSEGFEGGGGLGGEVVSAHCVDGYLRAVFLISSKARDGVWNHSQIQSRYERHR